MDSGHSAMGMTFRKDVERDILGREARHPGKENVPTLVTPWGVSKEAEHGFWVSGFRPRCSPFKHLAGLETCNPKILRLMWDHSVLGFSGFLSVNHLAMCKQSCVWNSLRKCSHFYYLPVLTNLKNSFDRVCQESLPSVVFFEGRRLCNLLRGMLLNLKENRSYQTQRSHPNMWITSLFRPLFSLVR